MKPGEQSNHTACTSSKYRYPLRRTAVRGTLWRGLYPGELRRLRCGLGSIILFAPLYREPPSPIPSCQSLAGVSKGSLLSDGCKQLVKHVLPAQNGSIRI
ncbi:hypothetical protein BDW22DRAFT_1350649 [Trametopsis cervina]|nr:hypothetical protein BDW22DRAFT_1350649 [Trametopsis cervina]